MKCKNCGTEFEQHHGAQKYCSVECRREYGLKAYHRNDKVGNVLGKTKYKKSMTPALERFFTKFAVMLKEVGGENVFTDTVSPK